MPCTIKIPVKKNKRTLMEMKCPIKRFPEKKVLFSIRKNPEERLLQYKSFRKYAAISNPSRWKFSLMVEAISPEPAYFWEYGSLFQFLHTFPCLHKTRAE
jgi:hypothetical protein